MVHAQSTLTPPPWTAAPQHLSSFWIATRVAIVAASTHTAAVTGAAFVRPALQATVATLTSAQTLLAGHTDTALRHTLEATWYRWRARCASATTLGLETNAVPIHAPTRRSMYARTMERAPTSTWRHTRVTAMTVTPAPTAAAPASAPASATTHTTAIPSEANMCSVTLAAAARTPLKATRRPPGGAPWSNHPARHQA